MKQQQRPGQTGLILFIAHGLCRTYQIKNSSKCGLEWMRAKKESMDKLSQLSLESAAREIPTAKASDSKRGSKAANHQAPWLSFGNSRSGRTELSLAPASLPHFIEFGCNFDLRLGSLV
ncbi:hypothetical protein ASPFODRAFT_607757 [Aspergillus luchuensis CBS 106.47]|uniref:Uncharacterized protein n=1 Tax=Aspergillus luchuensis (strain CBS 106.47) TaxID=1137211 RepID=A0A1M3TIN0_ASPLC|nr:hypothetical protein ASPFODRAFT_607757 [Aspergillus luchuensis CBS 106.47]